MVGLEPTRLAPLPPQDSVSTNSTTSANITDRLDRPAAPRSPETPQPAHRKRAPQMRPPCPRRAYCRAPRAANPDPAQAVHRDRAARAAAPPAAASGYASEAKAEAR